MFYFHCKKIKFWTSQLKVLTELCFCAISYRPCFAMWCVCQSDQPNRNYNNNKRTSFGTVSWVTWCSSLWRYRSVFSFKRKDCWNFHQERISQNDSFQPMVLERIQHVTFHVYYLCHLMFTGNLFSSLDGLVFDWELVRVPGSIEASSILR